MARSANSTVTPTTRVAQLQPYLRLLESERVSVRRLLAGAGIPAELMEYPSAAVPMWNAYRLGELACRRLGTEHLGLSIALARSLDDYGSYGKLLQQSLTVHEYLRKGIFFYNSLITGQRIWLSNHGGELRFNIASIGGFELGAYQSQLETLVITIKKLREAKPDWSPGEIRLAYRSREGLPDIEPFADSRITRGCGETYFTLPKELMTQRFPHRVDVSAGMQEPDTLRPLPEDLPGLVQLQVESLLPDRDLTFDLVAESLATSRRNLQRRLADQGLTYSQLLSQVRLRRAATWLEETDKAISEIAFDLGYTDASNFTRAFRRQLGVSPQTFREKARIN